jgi:hypothetical protein
MMKDDKSKSSKVISTDDFINSKIEVTDTRKGKTGKRLVNWSLGAAAVGISLVFLPGASASKTAGLLMTTAAIIGYLVGQKLTRDNRSRQNTVKLLHFAKNHKGLVTVTTLALEEEFSLEEAEALLQWCQEKGICQMELQSDGRVLYRFPDFIDPDDAL